MKQFLEKGREIPYLIVANLLVLISMKGYPITYSTLAFSTFFLGGAFQFMLAITGCAMRRKLDLNGLVKGILMILLGAGLFCVRKMGYLVIG